MEIFKNKKGRLTLAEVNERCDSCGMCSAYNSIFVDGDDGKPVAKNNGIIEAEDREIIEEIINICPQKAIQIDSFSLVKKSGTIDKASIEEYIKNNLISYSFPRPKYDDFSSGYYMIDASLYGPGYDYKSYNEAEKAGMNACKKKIFDKLDYHAKSALIEYKQTVLYPIITFEENTNNFYYKNIMDIEAVLSILCSEIKAVCGVTIDGNIAKIESEPRLGSKAKNLSYLSEIEDILYIRVQSEIESPDWYSSWIDVSDIYTHETSVFGLKEVKRYTYNASGVREMVNKHLLKGVDEVTKEHFNDAIKSQFADVVEPIELNVREIGKKILSMI